MSYKSTNNYYTMGGNYCSYCHSFLSPYDKMDEHGNYLGSYYQCDCEQGKIEQKMNDEIDVLEKEINEIKGKYAPMLQIDNDKINRCQYEIELEHLKEQYGIED